MKKYIVLIWLCCFVLTTQAAIQVKASAPSVVEEGEQFRLSFTINTQDITDFNFPSLKEFSVDMGPSRSSQSSFQMINGRTTQSSSVTYTYILSALKAGTYTIPAATVTISGKKYSSNTLHIEVLTGDNRNSQSRQQNRRQHERMHTQDVGSNITGKDLFITVTADKQHLYEQEAVVLTYKVYSLVNLSQLAGGMPDLEGFHTQEIELPQQKSLKMETYNGRSYGTVVWRQYVLFPQRSGTLTIPSIKFEGIVVQQNRNIDPIDAFFNGGSAMVEVKKTIVAPSLTLQVESLPHPRPAIFSGAVGKFDISASLMPNEIKVNDALTLRLTVSGSGNMKLMKAPAVNFPKDFETYDAKITDKIKVGRTGVSGNKSFDYLAVPRHAGEYKIPAVEFCYFDTEVKSYKTLKTQDFKIDVAKGKGHSSEGEYINKESVEMLASDIRYIHQGDVHLKQKGEAYFTTSGYYWSYVVPLLLFMSLVLVFRRKAVENANVAKMRNKKASKAATKRLKQASVLLRTGKPAEFYDEVLKALWGYVGDKLNISIADLNKENITEKLLLKGADKSIVQKLVETMNDCEFARYAPGDPMQAMDKIYESATEVINKMESSIKR
ncbi:BatD family protein [Phocaeicola sartorii]|uniref:BatD family protein n=1 Tax=Phocaeicola sartorii TaxID=671267 RepID=UPI002583878A|nr:BatD family protein [Phocaeicola sartorii]